MIVTIAAAINWVSSGKLLMRQNEEKSQRYQDSAWGGKKTGIIFGGRQNATQQSGICTVILQLYSIVCIGF